MVLNTWWRNNLFIESGKSLSFTKRKRQRFLKWRDQRGLVCRPRPVNPFLEFWFRRKDQHHRSSFLQMESWNFRVYRALLWRFSGNHPHANDLSNLVEAKIRVRARRTNEIPHVIYQQLEDQCIPLQLHPKFILCHRHRKCDLPPSKLASVIVASAQQKEAVPPQSSQINIIASSLSPYTDYRLHHAHKQGVRNSNF